MTERRGASAGTEWDADTLSEHTIPLRVPNGTADVTFTPLTDGKAVTPNEMRFLKNLYAFRRRPPTSKGPRQFSSTARAIWEAALPSPTITVRPRGGSGR